MYLTRSTFYRKTIISTDGSKINQADKVVMYIKTALKSGSHRQCR